MNEPRTSPFPKSGEMGARMQALDWTQTPAGAVESWSQSLKSTVRTLLGSRYPMILLWEQELIQIYNDAYINLIGTKHPYALGRSIRETQAESWDVIGPMITEVMTTGIPNWVEDQMLAVNRSGYNEEAHFSLSYSAIEDDAGIIRGMLCVCSEITQQVLGARRLRLQRDLAARAGATRHVDATCQDILNTIAEYPLDVPFALIYLRDQDDKTLQLHGSVHINGHQELTPPIVPLTDAESRWSLANVMAGQTAVITELDRAVAIMGGPWNERVHQAIALPIPSANVAAPLGVLVCGISPNRALDEDYQSFYELLTGQVSVSIRNAQAYEEERHRAEMLAEIDRAKTVFFSNISHEFRTPLTLMLNPLEDALASLEEDEQRKDWADGESWGELSPSSLPTASALKQQLQLAQRNAQRLLKLVNTLLDFSRLEAGRFKAIYEPTDLASLTADLASVFRSAIEKAGVQLVVDCPPLPEPVYVDQQLWEKIVFNLLSNALKFTFAGEIRVSLRWATGERETVNKTRDLQPFPISPFVELEVCDTGIGIPAHELPRLFERFHRVAEAQGRSYEGSGIGLSLVQELVKLHSGTVTVSSVIGEGSTFTVRLPLGCTHLPSEQIQAARIQVSKNSSATAYAEEALGWVIDRTAPSTTVALPRRASAHILLADDNADMRHYLQRLLSERYDVEAVADGQAVLEAIRLQIPDLVLIDVMMPKLDGFEVLRQLRANPQTREIPILLLSARAGEEAAVEGLEAGADDYLVKPFSARELLARVATNLVLGRSRQIASEKHFRALAAEIPQQSEAALRQSEERLRLAQRAAGAGLWDWDITTNQVAWSEEYYELYGLTATVTPSYEHWLASILDVDREHIEQAVREALVRRSDLNIEFRILHPLRGERWLTAIGQTFFDHNGQPKRMTGIALDITERKHAEQALGRYQLLSEHSRDIVLYISKDGRILEANRAAVQTYGYDRATLLTLRIADLRAEKSLPTLPMQLEQASQRGILFETVHRRQDGDHFPVEVSAQSAVINDETVILSVIRDITERRQAELEREELLAREQAARKAAEVAERQARFLAEASKTLTSSLDYEYTLSSVAQAVVPTLADWCAVDILKDDGTLERLATAHIDPAKVQWAKELHHRYPSDLNAPRGLAQALRTGQSEYYPTISDDQLVMVARDAEHLKILREIGFSSAMLVPLNARGKTLGAISFVSTESGRSYSPDDLSLAEELARRAAIALDNARLYRDVRQARQLAERAVDRTTRLQTVTAALSESLTPEQVAEVIVEQSIAVLQAAAVLVVLVSQDRTELEIVKSIGYTDDLVEAWRKFSIDTDVPLANAIRAGEPIWVETMLERIAHYPHLEAIYKRYDFNAWIALPLVVEGKSIGGLLLSFKEFRLLSQDDRDFILALTRQCAQAIVRAQLYAAEQWARAEAERANRIKDEFLAVLSHELRSPLNPILGWSKLLQQGKLDATRATHALMTIERNAKLQVQLIDDLLDISRILRGKLTLNTLLVSLAFVISAAIDTVRLAIDAKAIQLNVSLDPEVRPVLGDAARLQQVVWNLLSNAAKFTPSGGQITVTLTQKETFAQIQVQDNGKGIHPNFLPHVFEHFRQEDGAITRKFGGLGLGLAIVRQIVEMHGGTVQAESQGEGMGAIFTVKLPLAQVALPYTQATHPATSIADLKGLRILVVDDEADMRELTAFVLEQQGADVTTVASAQEALTVLDQFTPNVLISDIGMPAMDGYTLMQQIRKRAAAAGGQILAIALTAYAGEFNQQQAIAAGFQTHLSKPIEPDVLITVVARLCGRSAEDIG